jgi:hypothetical protein
MKKNYIHYMVYTILISIMIMQFDNVFTDNTQTLRAESIQNVRTLEEDDDDTRPVTLAEFNEKMRVIKGDYFGGPAYTEGTPFRFNINDLASTIDVSKVFVVVTGYKTSTGGNILSPLQITWSITTSDSDYLIEFLINDADGNPYQDPGFPGAWSSCKVKLQFHAYYADAMPDAIFIE